jgi:hypothetical protein
MLAMYRGLCGYIPNDVEGVEEVKMTRDAVTRVETNQSLGRC